MARAQRNRTVTLSRKEKSQLKKKLLHIYKSTPVSLIENRLINQDTFEVLGFLPDSFADLLILDPPYNLNKTFRATNFKKKSMKEYSEWFENCLVAILPKLKKTATVYVCCDWYSATAVYLVLQKYLKVRNRITWEREKGRGAKRNWKSASEDIWFATVSNSYTFNVDAIKIKRKVIAPYTDDKGRPKDWLDVPDGRFRLTYPSNLWNDLTVPFWSMPENTEHPTQKPEKLLAKIILASTNENDFVFDPFMGSGTSCIVARKLNRKFVGVEIETEYCLLAAKRLKSAQMDKSIQGYCEGVFWERNTLRPRR